MATQAFAGPVRTSRVDNALAQGSYKLDTLLGTADVDLTSPSGPTGGLIARAGLFVEVGGTVTFAGSDGTIDVWTVANTSYLNAQVAYVFKTGTGATGIHALT